MIVNAFEILGLDGVAGKFAERGDLAVDIAHDILDKARVVEGPLRDEFLVLAL